MLISTFYNFALDESIFPSLCFVSSRYIGCTMTTTETIKSVRPQSGLNLNFTLAAAAQRSEKMSMLLYQPNSIECSIDYYMNIASKIVWSKCTTYNTLTFSNCRLMRALSDALQSCAIHLINFILFSSTIFDICKVSARHIYCMCVCVCDTFCKFRFYDSQTHRSLAILVSINLTKGNI